MSKKHVKYSQLYFFGSAGSPDTPVGHQVFVVPVDHPDTENVTNGEGAWTSRVVSYDETTGIFETLNTVYSPE